MPITMDFTTTAMARPLLVDRTFRSFSKNLEGIDLKNCRLFINIDPLPPSINKRKEVIKVARKYFKEVHYNLPDQANFTAACNWIWSNAETEFIFNLEDDWELLRRVSVEHLLNYFEKNKNLFQVILRAYRYSYKTCALSPSIIHRRMYSAIGGKLKTDVNPEAQLRGKKFGIKMPTRRGSANKKALVVYPEKIKAVVLRDIGRAWINKTKYKKGGGRKKARFLTWETK